jgi:hypothetical protein
MAFYNFGEAACDLVYKFLRRLSMFNRKIVVLPETTATRHTAGPTLRDNNRWLTMPPSPMEALSASTRHDQPHQTKPTADSAGPADSDDSSQEAKPSFSPGSFRGPSQSVRYLRTAAQVPGLVTRPLRPRPMVSFRSIIVQLRGANQCGMASEADTSKAHDDQVFRRLVRTT